MRDFLCLVLTWLSVLAVAHATPLDDYVWKPDSHYGWVEMGDEYSWKGKVSDRGFTAYTLNMTSQQWLTPEDFSPSSQSGSIWWHYLVVIVPDNIQHKSNATLWITGGNQGSGIPSIKDEDIAVSAALSTATGTVTGVLFQVPNEHTTFAADPIQKSRSEDSIIAYTWDRFMRNTNEPEWLVRFPMVKASIKAMDAVTEFMNKKFPEKECNIEYYSVSGASKRGWTTWLVGAVDSKRVKVIVPVVLDAINFVKVLHHQFRSYGGWSYALSDYTDMNITTRLDTPQMRLLQEYEDPYFYRHRLTMPKLVVNAAMDEFQQLDDTHYWWNDLPEPKHFLLAPNAEHSLATGILEVVPAIGAFIQSQLEKDPVPQVHWTINQESGEIVATLGKEGKVHSATVWWAYSCGVNNWDNGKFRRDYRVSFLDNPCSCGPFAEGYCVNTNALWSKKELEVVEVDGKRTYSAKIDAPNDGRWVAYFIDFKFFNKHAVPFNMDELLKEMKPRMDESAGIHVAKAFRKGDFGGFPHDFGRFYEFTTEASVFPDIFPYEECHNESCGTNLV